MYTFFKHECKHYIAKFVISLNITKQYIKFVLVIIRTHQHILSFINETVLNITIILDIFYLKICK